MASHVPETQLSLFGKTILITGSARRLGKAFALAVAHAGGDLILHYGRSIAEANETKAEIEMLGRQAYLIQADLSDPAQTQTLLAEAISVSPLYGLVNSAAIFEPKSFDETDLASWNRHLQINLTAPFFLTQAFARSIPKSETGRVVNILDWRALRPKNDHFPYTISKAALAAFTKAAAVALAPNITVNGLALGAILPPEGQTPQPHLIDQIPSKRWATLDETSQALLFLLAGPAYITGEIIHVDGGRHLV